MRLLLLAAMFLTCVGSIVAQEPKPVRSTGDVDVADEHGSPRFDILEYQVEGNSVLAPMDVERAVYPFLGPGKTIKDVEGARSALERAYQQAGYLSVLVDIPEQNVEAGIVSLKVIEGRVDKLAVSGNRYYSRGYILAKVPSLAVGQVPNFPQVQKEMAKLSRAADRGVTPVLRPGQTPGTLEVELKVADKLPLHGGVELNNRQSPNTEPLRLQAYLRYDNLWQLEHSASVQYLVSPQDPSQVRALSGTYVVPIAESDRTLAFYGVISRSSVAALGSLTVLGDGGIIGARYIIPLFTPTSVYQSLTLGIDYKQFGQDVGFAGSEPVNTPISYVPLSVQYSVTAPGKRGTTQGGITLNIGPRGILDNKDAEFENNRFQAKANYVYVRGDISRDQSLWRGLTLFAKIGGQIADMPLISNEQFVAGGVDTVRGYLEAEQSGDDAYFGRIELRSPWFANTVTFQGELMAIAFLDGASLRLLDPLPGQKANFSLSSGGVGVLLKYGKHLDATVDLAVPFEDASFTHAWDPRFLFSLAYQF